MKKLLVLALIVLLSVGFSLEAMVEAGPPAHARGRSSSNNSSSRGNSSNNSSNSSNPSRGNSNRQITINETNEDSSGTNESPEGGERIPPGRQKGTPPGLVDKGGLPPGLHGRSVDELPPGIRNNPNFQEAVERLLKEEIEEELEEEIEEEIPRFSVYGDNVIELPKEEVVTSKYEAKLKEGDTNELISVNADWSLSSESDGVTIDQDGILEVTQEANPGEITVIANYISGEEELTANMKVEIYNPEIASLEIIGNDFITKDEYFDSPINLEYNILAKDQLGITMEDVLVTWNVESVDIDSISIDQDGIVTINQDINETSVFKVMASTEKDITAEINVTIYKQQISEVDIKGVKYKRLDESTEVPINLEYYAVVKDQLGRIIEEEKAVISLVTDELDNITMDENGVVSINELPELEESFSFEISAFSETNPEIQQSINVIVYYPMENSINVEGQEEIIIPDSGKTAEADYYATLLDQYGQDIEEADIFWGLAEEEIAGTSINAEGVLTVTDEAEIGTVKIYAAYIKDSGEEEEYILGDYDIQLIENELEDEEIEKELEDEEIEEDEIEDESLI